MRKNVAHRLVRASRSQSADCSMYQSKQARNKSTAGVEGDDLMRATVTASVPVHAVDNKTCCFQLSSSHRLPQMRTGSDAGSLVCFSKKNEAPSSRAPFILSFSHPSPQPDKHECTQGRPRHKHGQTSSCMTRSKTRQKSFTSEISTRWSRGSSRRSWNQDADLITNIISHSSLVLPSPLHPRASVSMAASSTKRNRNMSELTFPYWRRSFRRSRFL